MFTRFIRLDEFPLISIFSLGKLITLNCEVLVSSSVLELCDGDGQADLSFEKEFSSDLE